MKILVAYDGSLNAKAGLRYGIEKIREAGGEVIAAYVFRSSMFIDYGAGPKAEEIARAEAFRYIEEAKKILFAEAKDVRAEAVMLEGRPEEEIANYAGEKKIDLIVSPPAYKSLAKKAPCPVSIIPGMIIVPLDNTDSYLSVLEAVRKEASLTGSGVLLLGLIPVHLYSRSEKDELDKITRETSDALKKAKKLLVGYGINTMEIIRSGYPDEEIIKAADEYAVTMIIIPEGGDKPSELAKAAGIILDEKAMMRKPLYLTGPEKAPEAI